MIHDCVDVCVCAHAPLLLSHLRLIKRSTMLSQVTENKHEVTSCS